MTEPIRPTNPEEPAGSLAPSGPPTVWTGSPGAPAFAPAPTLTSPLGIAPDERVARGLAVALLAVLAAGTLAVVVWNLGFVASITSALLAIGASVGYTRAAGAAPRRGLGPLVVLIVLGVVGTALAFVGWDASQYYSAHAAEAASAGVTRSSFVWQNVTDGQVLSSYAGDLAFYFVFAVLGTFGVVRRLLRQQA